MPAELLEGAALIDGVAIARDVRADVSGDVASLVARGITPGLTVVIVGDDPASHVYVRSKGKAATEAGMRSETIRLDASISQDELVAQVDRLNADPAVHGILVQMPLPKHIDSQAIIARIDPAKDVDGFHPMNAGRLLVGDPTAFVACTPLGVMELLSRSGVETRGRHAVVIGRSNIVGKPMAVLLAQPGVDATVTLCHSRTADLGSFARQADIIIAAAGRPGTVTADMVKSGAVVIDVGTTRVADPSSEKGYRLSGDVDFGAVRRVAGRITPVPGGVGPMTIAMLMKNTVKAARQISGVS